MKKIICKESRIDALFDKYLLESKLKGHVSDTIKNKQITFSVFYRFLEERNIRHVEELTQALLDDFTTARLNKGTANKISINSYNISLNAFLHWLYRQGYLQTKIAFKMLKTQEAIKRTYSQEELAILLQKPNVDSFADYRTWVIINYILGTGNRISSVLSITNADVNLLDGFVNLPHTKNKKAQIVPLSSSLIFILKDYMDVRQGEPTDKLFCTEYGKELGRGGADKALLRYCEQRGVVSLGHHALRHTFAKIAVRDCHIDTFRLQRLMGHSDIKITQNYVRLFSNDLKQDIDTFSPLELLVKSQEKPKKIKL